MENKKDEIVDYLKFALQFMTILAVLTIIISIIASTYDYSIKSLQVKEKTIELEMYKITNIRR
jgi:hypothetical protein